MKQAREAPAHVGLRRLRLRHVRALQVAIMLINMFITITIDIIITITMIIVVYITIAIVISLFVIIIISSSSIITVISCTARITTCASAAGRGGAEPLLVWDSVAAFYPFSQFWYMRVCVCAYIYIYM